MKLYGIKACDTCRKALKTLRDAGQDVAFVDIRDTPLEPELLLRFHEKFNDALLNTRSTTWRGLSEEERKSAPLDLLAAHPTLMKRPVIEADGLYLGWGKDTQSALL
jgi:arsenate reductase